MKADIIIYSFPAKDIVICSHKIAQEIYPAEYSKSMKLVLDIPGATIKNPIVRLRLLGDLPGLTLGNTAGWSLYDLYYIKE